MRGRRGLGLSVSRELTDVMRGAVALRTPLALDSQAHFSAPFTTQWSERYYVALSSSRQADAHAHEAGGVQQLCHHQSTRAPRVMRVPLDR